MKSISTGFGLCVLSGTIAACFAVPHFGGEGRAFASNASGRADSPADRPALSVLGCATEPPQQWFSPEIKILPYCYDGSLATEWPCGPLTGDVNGDGRIDYTLIARPSIDIIDGGRDTSAYAGPVIYRSVFQSIGGELEHRYGVVFGLTTGTISAIRSQIAGVTRCSIYFRGARDMDGDGDQDLYVNVSLESAGQNQLRQGWFENTGYQSAPPPNPYDLDHDNVVGVADLSLLLMSFTD